MAAAGAGHGKNHEGRKNSDNAAATVQLLVFKIVQIVRVIQKNLIEQS